MIARALTLGVLLLCAAPAAAQDPRLNLFVSADPARLDAEALRAELERELQGWVRLVPSPSTATLVVTLEADVLRFHYREGRDDIARETAAPTDPRELLTVAALIGTALARDEAREALAMLPMPEPAAEAEAEAEPEAEAEREPEPEPEPEPEAEPEPEPEPEDERDARPWVPFGIDLLPGIGFSSVYGGTERRSTSFGVFGDLYGAVDGYALGLLFTVGGEVRGVQQSAILAAAERVDGLQLAMINVATERVNGVQLGAVNVAGGPVRGPQVGVVNIGETADVGVGLINVYSRGDTHLELTGATTGGFQLALKHGVGWWHSIYSIGVNPFYGDVFMMAGLGFGVRVELAEIAFLDLDLTVHYGWDSRWQFGVTFLNGFRVLAGIRPVEGFAIVFGLGLEVFLTSIPGTPVYTPALETVFPDDTRLWPTIVLGLQAF